ncbi:hypothetical protein [Staphylococcus shinii]|uniref:hypothetical protein n=1 Tax=Staphylococcus shinii TaxID=2912228 RepID=UPI003F842279
MRKLWTNEEIEQATQLYKSNKNYREIGEILGRNESNVRKKLISLGIANPSYKINREHTYEIGEVVNNELKIIERIRVKCGKNTQKGYVVKSLAFPDDKNDYEISEYSLKNGAGCAYARGLRICEENSLWSKVETRKYIRDEDIEYSKTIAPNHTANKMIFKCNNCDKEKEMTPEALTCRDFSCQYCSTNTSYPELFFIAYLDAKGIEYEYQVRLDNSPLKFDFQIKLNNEYFYVECNGLQHYNAQENWGGAKGYGKQKASDVAKKFYCEMFNLNLIVLDCRESSFEFIKKKIEDNKTLPNIIDDEMLLMLDIINKNKTYNTKEIIRLYVEEKKTTTEVAEIIGRSKSTVGNILKRNNVSIRTCHESKRLKMNLPIETIIRMYEVDGVTQREIAKKFNCGQSTIGRLLRRKLNN